MTQQLVSSLTSSADTICAKDKQNLEARFTGYWEEKHGPSNEQKHGNVVIAERRLLSVLMLYMHFHIPVMGRRCNCNG